MARTHRAFPAGSRRSTAPRRVALHSAKEQAPVQGTASRSLDTSARILRYRQHRTTHTRVQSNRLQVQTRTLQSMEKPETSTTAQRAQSGGAALALPSMGLRAQLQCGYRLARSTPGLGVYLLGGVVLWGVSHFLLAPELGVTWWGHTLLFLLRFLGLTLVVLLYFQRTGQLAQGRADWTRLRLLLGRHRTEEHSHPTCAPWCMRVVGWCARLPFAYRSTVLDHGLAPIPDHTAAFRSDLQDLATTPLTPHSTTRSD